MSFLISPESPLSKDANNLIKELSNALSEITGNSGESSFDISDVEVHRSVFMIARNEKGEAIGCGAIRPFSNEIAEVKRMYAKPKTKGVGTAILRTLEIKAIQFGYKKLYLETRKINETAIIFYLKRGFEVIENYGKYIGRDEAVCFSKNLQS